ncbi:hypothetical protein OIE13_27660 [Streptosporangium sp. NBC_01810]|uniref:hypothetical protein n=1 Tax=Streptosporangium sp. NBC_01810 TaxID=2975951 RepID=UPI002DD9466D|nr:hypothetical protein [Streptosporangium sp. NBC_01810]WSA24688.1 hypothetical protein OIE13_27660 [Streptosporangium sp. NBC_01810]
MKHRGAVILLVLGLVAVGFMSMGFMRAANEGSDLGGPVVVSPSPGRGGQGTPSASPGKSGEPGSGVNSGDPGSGVKSGDPGSASPGKSEKPARSAQPTPRKSKAEPVRPPSPRLGGGGDDDDDDDGEGDDD